MFLSYVSFIIPDFPASTVSTGKWPQTLANIDHLCLLFFFCALHVTHAALFLIPSDTFVGFPIRYETPHLPSEAFNRTDFQELSMLAVESHVHLYTCK